jgi:hypothetical protein
MKNEQNQNNIVGMLFEIDTVDNKKIVDVFQFEQKRLWATIYAMSEAEDIKQKRKRIRGFVTAFLSGENEKDAEFQSMLKQNFNGDVQEYMRTLMINWACTYDSPKNWLNENKGKSIGIVVSWNAKEEDLKVLVNDHESFLTAANRLGKKYNF